MLAHKDAAKLVRQIRTDTGLSVRALAEAAGIASSTAPCTPSQRFLRADLQTQHRMITAEPSSTDDQRWDAFLAALAEWLAVQAGLPTPAWAHSRHRYLDHGWWLTRSTALRAWEYAGSPASFQAHGVYLHRDSLVNV